MAKIPDKAEMQKRFMALDLKDRRHIIRAVNRGLVVEDRKLAVIAVGVARRQQRFWKRAWLLGPAVGMVQALFPEVTVQAAAVNSVVATLLLALLSWYWFIKARRSEQLNLERAGAARSVGPAAGGEGAVRAAGRRARSHLPGRGAARADDEVDDDGDEAEEAADPSSDGSGPQRQLPPGQRPYKPRRQKRRDRG